MLSPRWRPPGSLTSPLCTNQRIEIATRATSFTSSRSTGAIRRVGCPDHRAESQRAFEVFSSLIHL